MNWKFWERKKPAPRYIEPSGRILDYRHTGWGHALFLNWSHETKSYTGQVFYNGALRVGDTLRVEHGYVFLTKVEWCFDPEDLWNVEAKALSEDGIAHVKEMQRSMNT